MLIPWNLFIMEQLQHILQNSEVYFFWILVWLPTKGLSTVKRVSLTQVARFTTMYVVKWWHSTWNMWHATCSKWMPSFYYIHCSETWHLCQWHTFHCRQALTVALFLSLKYLRIAMEKRKKNASSFVKREGYSLNIPEDLRDIPLSTKLMPLFFFFSTDVPRNIHGLEEGL